MALAVVDDGGYGAGSRIRFGIAAFAAAAAAFASDSARARRFLRAPVVLVLVALAALGTVSVGWTVGIADETLRWGLVTGAYAAVLFAAAVLVRDGRGAIHAAALIAVLAVGMGVVGLIAAATTDVPLAQRAAGLWRPAGTFQYSPALALLVVSALPALLTAMVRAQGRLLLIGAAFGGAVAGATLALAESRTQLAFAVLTCGAMIAFAPRAVAVSRGAVLTAVALIATAGLGAYAVAGGYIPVTPAPDGTARLLGIAGVVVAATIAWLAVRAGLRRGIPALALAAALIAVGVAGAVAKPAPRLITSGLAPAKTAEKPKQERATLHPIRDRLLHGRLRLWGEALDTFADRPLHGGGADSYYFASSEHQGPRAVYYAHSFPLELAAELGIAGLLLALALYGTAGVALWRARAGPGSWLLGAGAIAFLAANLVDWPWHLAGSGAVWALALGGMIGTAGATRGSH